MRNRTYLSPQFTVYSAGTNTTTQQGSGHSTMHPSDFLCLHLFLGDQCSAAWGKTSWGLWLWSHADGTQQGKHCSFQTGSLLPILAPVPMPQPSVYQINPFHGPTHFEWRFLKLFDTQDHWSRWTRSASEKGSKLKKLSLPLAVWEKLAVRLK